MKRSVPLAAGVAASAAQGWSANAGGRLLVERERPGCASAGRHPASAKSMHHALGCVLSSRPARVETVQYRMWPGGIIRCRSAALWKQPSLHVVACHSTSPRSPPRRPLGTLIPWVERSGRTCSVCQLKVQLSYRTHTLCGRPPPGRRLARSRAPAVARSPWLSRTGDASAQHRQWRSSRAPLPLSEVHGQACHIPPNSI